MLLRKLSIGLAYTAAIGSAHALDVVLAEDFNDVSALSAAGWAQRNNSATPLGSPWFQGDAGLVSAAGGPWGTHAGASYRSTLAITGEVSNWLITPMVTLNSGSELTFFVRNLGEGFVDSIEARFSANGASTNVGTTTASVGDFTTLLIAYQSRDQDDGWLRFAYTFSGLSGDTEGRVGFRYVVDDAQYQGNYLGLDSVVLTGVTPVPEPAAHLLFVLGLAGVMLRRRLGVGS